MKFSFSQNHHASSPLGSELLWLGRASLHLLGKLLLVAGAQFSNHFPPLLLWPPGPAIYPPSYSMKGAHSPLGAPTVQHLAPSALGLRKGPSFLSALPSLAPGPGLAWWRLPSACLPVRGLTSQKRCPHSDVELCSSPSFAQPHGDCLESVTKMGMAHSTKSKTTGHLKVSSFM